MGTSQFLCIEIEKKKSFTSLFMVHLQLEFTVCNARQFSAVLFVIMRHNEKLSGSGYAVRWSDGLDEAVSTPSIF